MRALRWEVLFPGAAVASMATHLSCAGGDNTKAGKQEALSWRMIFPEIWAGSFWKDVWGAKRKRSGMCSSLVNEVLIRVVGVRPIE